MKISIAMGFFLPVPPVAGGATEKIWHRLAADFAQRGQEVTLISRSWPGWPDREVQAGVTYRRIRGYDHTANLARNLWRDWWWSWRASVALPPSDVTISNAISLPLLLRRSKAGRIVVMTGRMPKGQYRLYRRIDRVLAVSSPVRAAILAENPKLHDRVRVIGCPIDCTALATMPAPPPSGVATIGFVGRLHREKGLDLLIAAVRQLAENRALPPWRLSICGPAEVHRGGSGEGYVASLQDQLATFLAPGRYEFLPPCFDERRLAQVYRGIDLFCYPSVAEKGETFGVAVAEAMAAGAVPVVSALDCFADLVRPGETGLVFDHRAKDAPARLAASLAAMLQDPGERSRLARAAQRDVRRYDFPAFAERLLADFTSLPCSSI